MPELQNVQFTDHRFEPLKNFISSGGYSAYVVLVDEHTLAHCYPVLSGILPNHHIVEIKSGEEAKNLQTCIQIWERFTSLELDRKALVINLGGGVIGDMGGFCAATYKRGVHFVQVPTTLLSQVDASVGGKLGIDFQGYKNHIGVFSLPQSVFIYPGFLKTLDKRELRSGFAEIIKHCLIRDAAKWQQLQSISVEKLFGFDLDLEGLIRHSVGIKAAVVEADPTEKGLRKILNFGHTIGHAIESFLLPTSRKLLHGEAISAGMVTEAWLSVQKGFIRKEQGKCIESYLISFYGKAPFTLEECEAIAALSVQDKKNEGGIIKMSLLERVGFCGYDFPVTMQEIREALRYYTRLGH